MSLYYIRTPGECDWPSKMSEMLFIRIIFGAICLEAAVFGDGWEKERFDVSIFAPEKPAANKEIQSVIFYPAQFGCKPRKGRNLQQDCLENAQAIVAWEEDLLARWTLGQGEDPQTQIRNHLICIWASELQVHFWGPISSSI